MSLKVYILSPHIDDAAFGLTLTIARLINNKIPVTLINCFTVTKWTCVFVSRDIEVVSRLRKQEDAAYNKLFNSAINIINLDLTDAPLRNGYIFQTQSFQPNEIDLIEHLAGLIEQHVDGLLLCPLAIGNHIDHLICREAVMKLYRKINVIFFEDLPYANRISSGEILLHIRELERELQVQMTSYINATDSHSINKEQAIRVYKSQLNDEICDEIIRHMNALRGERLWGEAAFITQFKNISGGRLADMQ